MFNQFSLIEDLSRLLGTPLVSSSTSFDFMADGCDINLTFIGSDLILMESFVGGAKLCLSLDSLMDFAERLKKLNSIHSVAQAVSLDMSPVSELSKDSYPVFVRLNLYLPKDPKDIKDLVEGAYRVLKETRELVIEFLAKDRGLNSLKETWKKTLSSVNKNEKGKLLEEFVVSLITRDESFVVKHRNLRTESEELDIVVENTGKTQFYSN